MISVIIPLYNKEKQIEHTLLSVLCQTFKDFEIVIVNDGSTDNSVKVVNKFVDGRIRIIHQKNAGVSAARNRGLEEAKGEFVAFLDADDIWEPNYLECQFDLSCKYSQCSVFATSYQFVDNFGQYRSAKINNLPFREEDGELENYFQVASYSHPPICSSSVMIRKSSIREVGGFPIGIKSGEDLLTWAKLAIRFKIAYSKKVLASFFVDRSAFNVDQQKREPEQIDFVGKELDSLLLQNPKTIGLKEYNALWHKMRCRIYLEKGYKRLAFHESITSIKYHFTLKVLFFIFLSFCPQIIIKKVFG